jgi:hypothetical protein
MLLVGSVATAQGPGPLTGANSSVVGQTGAEQNAIVNQIGTNQKSTVKQRTKNNDAYVDQGVLPSEIIGGAGNNKSASNIASIDQMGNDNWAKTSQNNWDNTATQTQVGDRNRATIWQDEVSVPFKPVLDLVGDDTATQTQTGDDNEATIDQGTSGNNPLPMVGTFPLMNALTSAIPFTPHGRNDATQTQEGDFNVAYTSQGGKDNESIIDQSSVGYAASVTDRNVANHYQYGNGNYAKTTQEGFRNLDNILQEGNTNISNTMQTGTSSGNMNSVSQQGNFHNSSVTQSN